MARWGGGALVLLVLLAGLAWWNREEILLTLIERAIDQRIPVGRKTAAASSR